MNSLRIKRSFIYGLLSTIFVLFVCKIPATVNAVRAPAPIEVNKCCRIGEQLEKNQKCLVGGTEQWWPLIYLILKQTYFVPRGEAPRFLRVREQRQPACENPEIFINNMALFSNGSLFLLERNAFVEPDNFCVDKDSALVCFPRPQGVDSLRAPIKLTKVRKCCGYKLVYNTEANTCVSVDDGHAVLSKKLITNSTTIDFVFGFPTCGVTNHFTIAGKFNENHLNLDGGSLTMDSGRQFKWDEFCLEHTMNDLDESDVNVFTCAEHLAVADTVPTTKGQQVNKYMRFSIENSLDKNYSKKFFFFFLPQDSRFVIYPISLLISVIFLIATLTTGYLLPSNHHVLHWRCQTFYVGCLLVGDLLLAINQIFGREFFGKMCFGIGEYNVL